MPNGKFERLPMPSAEKPPEKRRTETELEIRSERELTEEERAQFEEAMNLLNLDRGFEKNTLGEKRESEAYREAIETLRKLKVREGRELLFRRGLNDRDYYVQIEAAEVLGEIGLPQDLKALEFKFGRCAQPRTAGEEMVGSEIAKAMARIKEKFGLTKEEEMLRKE